MPTLNILFMFVLAVQVIAQPTYITTYEWGSDKDDTVTSVIYHTKSDVIYAAGYTYGSIGTVGSSYGNSDMFVSILPLVAGPLTFQYGTAFEDRATAVAYDVTRGYVHVVGWTAGLLAGDRIKGEEDATLSTLTLSGYAASWEHYQWGTAGSDKPVCSFVDPLSSSNVYVTGTTSGSFSGYTNAGGDDIFVSIKDSLNTFTSYQWGTTASDTVGGCTFDATTGIFYVVGSTPGAFSGYTNFGGYDAFVSVVSRSGSVTHFQWGTQYSEFVTGAAYNTRLKALFVVGYTNGAFGDTHPSGAQDAFLSTIIFNSDGNISVHNHQWGTVGNDIPTGISNDNIYNTLYISGYTSGEFEGATSSGGIDSFLSVFSATNPDYPPIVFQWGTNATDECVAVASSSSDPNVYCVGWTEGVFSDASAFGGRDLFASGIRKEILPIPIAPTEAPANEIEPEESNAVLASRCYVVLIEIMALILFTYII